MKRHEGWRRTLTSSTSKAAGVLALVLAFLAVAVSHPSLYNSQTATITHVSDGAYPTASGGDWISFGYRYQVGDTAYHGVGRILVRHAYIAPWGAGADAFTANWTKSHPPGTQVEVQVLKLAPFVSDFQLGWGDRMSRYLVISLGLWLALCVGLLLASGAIGGKRAKA